MHKLNEFTRGGACQMNKMLISLYIILLAPIAYTSCIPARDCPLGLYCPDGYTCKDSGADCVDVCYVTNVTHQGNGTTGRCEDASTSNDIWFDSSLYEVFVYRKLDQNEMLKNISLIATYAFRNNAPNSDEDFLNNITFRLNSSHFDLTTLYSSFEGFQNESTSPEIVKRVSIIALSLMLGDYNMKIQAIWQNKTLAESDVIIHVVDPLPATLPVPVTCVQFSSENYSVSSLDWSLKVTLTLSGLTQSEPFDVFVVAKDTLSADSDDFTPGWYRAIFEPGTTIAKANEIPILSDDLDESIEQFTLELYIPGASYKIGIQTGVLNKATASIKDVSEVFAEVGELRNVPPFITLTISCDQLISTLVPLNVTLNITWTKDERTAENGSAPNLIITQDRHQLILAPTKLKDGGQLGNSGTYACTVCSDNETCIKSQSHCEICRTPRLLTADPISRRSKVLIDTVKCGENFCFDPTLTMGITFTCEVDRSVALLPSITIYKDNTLYRKGNGFTLSEVMIPHSLGTYKTVLNGSCGMDIATSILSLCDPMMVYFDALLFTGSESSGNITVSMELIRHSSVMSSNITVYVIPSSQSAEGNGVDYTSTSITATFPAGINTTTVNIPVTRDNIVERNETIQLKIYVPVPTKYAVETGNPSKAIAIITDSSNCSINFRQSNYIINENNGSVQVELVLSNPVSFDFNVIIHHQDISATGGVDYNSGPYNITIPAGEILVLFNVTIIDDNVNEENETFNLIMATTQELPDGIYFGENLTVMILIEDNDALTVSFDQELYEFNEENGVAQPVLVLSSPSSMDITVIINSSDSTAIGNVEYTPGPYTITIPAGVTRVPLNITLLASDAESVSEFVVYIAYSNEVMIGDYSQAVVAIIHSNVLYCNQASDVYFGLDVIWDRTPAGKTVQLQCIGNELAGMITRRCDIDGTWLSPVVACVRKSFENINDKLRTIKNGSLSEEEKLAKMDTIAMVLANITTPQDDSYFPNELTIAVDVLSGVNIITEKVIGSRHPNDTFFKDTTKALNNLLSSSNEAGWKELQQMSPEVNQRLVQNSENFGKILAQTLNNETTKILETQENIVIKTELTTQDSIDEGISVSFPDDADDLTMFAGQTTRITLPNELLRSAISNLSSDTTAFPIVNMVFRNLSSILPNTSNASDPITSVISTQLPNPVTTPDDQPIVLTFKVNDEDGNAEGMIRQCVFYDYGIDGSEVGRWSTQGVEIVDELSNDTIITCYSTHLTSFAVLVSPQDERPPSAEDKALSIISYIGCAISLVFLIISIIILSYLMYGKPPKKRNPILIHLNLCIALALGLVVFLSGIETAVDNEGACKFVAALLQYFFTSAFCWMLCEGVMLYMMLITVFGNKLNHYLFFLALGWGPAIPIVAISVGVVHRHYGTDYYCWIKSDDGAIAAFIAPIGTIILINCVFFMMTLRVIYKNRSGNTKKSFDQATAKEILKAGMFLLPLLGMTWIIGILAVNNETQVFAWIFAILNSLQGLFIFIFHVARNKEMVAKFHVAKDRYIFGREGSSVYNRVYGSKRGSGGTAFTKSRESRSSASEMLPSHSSRKESTYSVDDVFTSNELEKNNDPPKQDDPDIIDSNKAQDATVTYSKEEEVKILDNSNGSDEKCEAHNEKDEKVETEDNNNNS